MAETFASNRVATALSRGARSGAVMGHHEGGGGVVDDFGFRIQALLDAGIEAAFPHADLSALADIDRGFGSLVVGVPHQVVVRVPRSMGVAAAHRRERDLLPRIAHRLNVAVPEVSWVVPPRNGLPLGASAYRWIEGALPSAPVSSDSALVGDLAAFLGTLHQTPIGLVADIGLSHPTDLALARSEAAVTIEPVLRARQSPSEFSRLQTRLTDILNDPVLDAFTPVLRHGDPWWGNLLVDEQSGQLMAVLDWEEAAIGDPAEDLATLQYLGEAAATAVTEAYGRLVGGLDARFRRRSDHHFALREVFGIRRCIETHDDDEIGEELQKLRSGPLLG